MYDVNNVIANLYRVLDNGTIYYLSTQISISELGSFQIDSITNPAGSKYRYNLSGSPDLSGFSIGQYVYIKNTHSEINSGCFEIVGVNDGSDYIEVNNYL